MGEQLPQILQQVGTVAAALAGVFLALLKTKDALLCLSNTRPLLRKSVKADLELLKLMEEKDPGYEELKNHVRSQVNTMIKEEKGKELVKANWAQMLIGLAMAGGGGYWTYYIVTHLTPSNWWTILTVWMALAGVGFLFRAFEKPTPDKPSVAGTGASPG